MSYIDIVHAVRGRDTLGAISLADRAQCALRDALVRRSLEFDGVTTVANTVETALMCADRSASRRFLQFNGLPCVEGAEVSNLDGAVEAARELGGYPVALKSLREGCTPDTWICRSERDLAKRIGRGPVLMERVLAGAMVRAQVIRWQTQSICLPLIYQSSMGLGGTQIRLCPAPIPADETESLRALAMEAADALNTQGILEVDMVLLDNGEVRIEDTQTRLTSTVLMPMAVERRNVFGDLLDMCTNTWQPTEETASNVAAEFPVVKDIDAKSFAVPAGCTTMLPDQYAPGRMMVSTNTWYDLARVAHRLSDLGVVPGDVARQVDTVVFG